VTLVVDASFVTAALQGAGSSLGDWAAETCRGHDLFAPQLLPVEVASALRRAD
jgi:predicted nucleic acid-binding protein